MILFNLLIDTINYLFIGTTFKDAVNFLWTILCLFNFE